ncbi:enoyl-CoA hydratase-related protein [Mycolicibacterium septicum]|uniref:enoyl-CoA hydratase-related protein n=1 Tax=Mycolicibacterium septicum TaxID=98668 RepID=UPI002362125A|nr:enoyl-CoA hydratase-related protein [Mycolicibacterium septicum]
MTGEVLLDIDGAIATITLSNVPKRNALTVHMRRALVSMVNKVQDDPAVRGVVLTGDGAEAFVAGADLVELAGYATPAELLAEAIALDAELTAAWDRLEKPVVAMIQGYCIGAGLLLALDADIRIAGEGSQFAIPAARLGLGLGSAYVEGLAATVGSSWAAEILFSARRLSAAEALRIGLVNHVVPAGELRTFTMALVTEIAQNAPLTIAASKVAIRQLRLEPAQRDHTRAEALSEACNSSADLVEGQTAFKEKRQPRFTGR